MKKAVLDPNGMDYHLQQTPALEVQSDEEIPSVSPQPKYVPLDSTLFCPATAETRTWNVAQMYYYCHMACEQ